MAQLDRKQAESLYKIFQQFALADQKSYYLSTVSRFRKSARQVNTLRAIASLLTGLSAASAGLIVQSAFVNGARCAANVPGGGDCAMLSGVVVFLTFMGVVMPVLGGVFNTMADLYQWDRMITVYDAALENIEVADSRSPDPEMDDATYLAALQLYVGGALTVMRDETAQWGQLVRTPPQLEAFLEEARKQAEAVSGGPGAKPGGATPSGSGAAGGTAAGSGEGSG